MYAQLQQDGTWRELRGNVVFSVNVYQTAESLSDEQRAEFNVYPLDDVQPSYDDKTQTVERGGIVFDEQTMRASVTWTIRQLTAEEIIARTPPLSRLDFMNRFTLSEMAAIYTAAKQNVLVEIMLDQLKMAEFINVADQRTAAGIQMLEQAGLIAAGRATEILGQA